MQRQKPEDTNHGNFSGQITTLSCQISVRSKFQCFLHRDAGERGQEGGWGEQLPLQFLPDRLTLFQPGPLQGGDYTPPPHIC